MTKKDRQALHQQTTTQLQKMQTEIEMQLMKARMEKHAGKLANTSLVKTLSDDLARVKTVLRIQQLTAKTEPVAAPKVKQPAKKVTKRKTK